MKRHRNPSNDPKLHTTQKKKKKAAKLFLYGSENLLKKIVLNDKDIDIGKIKIII